MPAERKAGTASATLHVGATVLVWDSSEAEWVEGAVTEIHERKEEQRRIKGNRSWGALRDVNEDDDAEDSNSQKTFNEVHVSIPSGSRPNEVIVRESDVYNWRPESAQVEDLVKLDFLCEPGVLRTLKHRYKKEKIYTFCGSILIALNPYKEIPGIYDQKQLNRYKNVSLGKLPPHVFAIADEAFRLMMIENCSQSILISGESGAGKTETAKRVMQYLAAQSSNQEPELQKANSERISDRTVAERVLATNPLLEAFGNAKTVRNNNSSRFGKYIEILFTPSGRIESAMIHTFLLERSRVVRISDPERSFHIFYQLLAGADPSTLDHLQIPQESVPEDFFYLSQSSCTNLGSSSITDAKQYKETLNAMEIVGIDSGKVLELVAAILHLGNIQFEERSDSADNAAKLEDRHSIEARNSAASLLQVDPEALENALLTRKIRSRDETVIKELNAEEAASGRDALAKKIYFFLFDWLVEACNQAVGNKEKISSLSKGSANQSSSRTIGILDIYGFESFEDNSLEQLCINLANEKLQQQFNNTVFKREQEEYISEDINWSSVTFKDNQDVLDLLENKLLPLIDEHCRMPQANPDALSQSMRQKLLSHPRFQSAKLDPNGFIIDHYAGEVPYSSEELLEKNKDYVISEHVMLIANSRHDLLLRIFEETINDHSGEDKRSATRRKPSKPKSDYSNQSSGSAFKLKSIGLTFKEELSALMDKLNSTRPHYIRCIKPNSDQVAGVFTTLSIAEQLRCGGVMEAIRIAMAGFPTRRTFLEFAERYAIILGPDVARKFALLSLDSKWEEAAAYGRQITSDILKTLPFKSWQIGKTRAFLKQGQLAEVETIRNSCLTDSAVQIQKHVRRYLARTHFLRLISSAIVFQKIWRGRAGRKEYAEMRKQYEEMNAKLLEVERALQASEKSLHTPQVLETPVVQSEKKSEPVKSETESKNELSILENSKVIEEMAAEHKELRANVKKLENENLKLKSEVALANKWKDKSAEVVERVLTLSNTLAQVREELAKVKAESLENERAAMEAKQSKEAVESLLKISKDRQIENEKELTEYRMEKFSSIASAEVERQDLETELRNTQLQLEAEEKRSQALQEYIDSQSEELGTLNAKHVSGIEEIGKHKREINRLTEANKRLERLADERQKMMDGVVGEIRSKLSGKQTRDEYSQREILYLKQSLRDAKSQLRDMEHSFIHEKQMHSATKAAKDTLEADIKAAANAAETATAGMEDLREERRSLESQNQAFQLQLEALQEELRRRQDAEDFDIKVPETPAGERGSESAEVTIKRLSQELETNETTRRALEAKLAAADMAKETASRMTAMRIKLDENERRLQKSEAEKDMIRKQFQAETQSLRRELMSLRKAKERMQAAVEVFAEKQQKSPFRDRSRQVLDELANLRKEPTEVSLCPPPPYKSNSPDSPSTAESNKPITPGSSPPEAQGTPRHVEA